MGDKAWDQTGPLLSSAWLWSKCGRLQLFQAFHLFSKARDNVPSNKLPSTFIYLYSQLVQLSDHVSFFVQWTGVNIESYHWSKCIEMCLWSIQSQLGYLHHHWGGGVGDMVRARGQAGLEWNCISWAWQDLSTHELMAAVAPCTRLAHDQASRHFRIVWRRAHEPLSLAEELVTVDGFWGECSTNVKCSY